MAGPEASEDAPDNMSLPVKLPHLRGVSAVMCGGYHTCAIISGISERLIQHVIDGNLKAFDGLKTIFRSDTL
jgi:hypothetical protein